MLSTFVCFEHDIHSCWLPELEQPLPPCLKLLLNGNQRLCSTTAKAAPDFDNFVPESNICASAPILSQIKQKKRASAYAGGFLQAKALLQIPP